MSTDRISKELEEKFAQLNRLVRQVEDQMSAIKELRERLGEIGHDEDEPKSQFLKIAEALLSKGNNPRSARWLTNETGISRSSLSQILHRTHKESFISLDMPGYTRKKLWALTKEAADQVERQVRQRKGGQATLFGDDENSDFAGLKATNCCAIILKEHENEPMSALTLARVSLARGYRGEPHGSEDEKLLRTAKSFWAALGRDERFEEVRPLVFALRRTAEIEEGERDG